MDSTIAAISEQWARVNASIAEIVRGMSRDDLMLQDPVREWPIWAIVAHTMGGRVYWLCGVLKQPGADTTPFPKAMADTGEGWEDDLQTPRSTDELLDAIDSTWKIVAGWLQKWSPEAVAHAYPRRLDNGVEWHSPPSILTRLMTHDGYHAGEVSLLLGMHGRQVADIWHNVVAQAPLSGQR